MFYECSAKEDTNVTKAFEELARNFIKTKQQRRQARRDARDGSGSNRSSTTIKNQNDGPDLEEHNDIYNLHAQLSQSVVDKKAENSCKC